MLSGQGVMAFHPANVPLKVLKSAGRAVLSLPYHSVLIAISSFWETQTLKTTYKYLFDEWKINEWRFFKCSPYPMVYHTAARNPISFQRRGELFSRLEWAKKMTLTFQIFKWMGIANFWQGFHIFMTKLYSRDKKETHPYNINTMET